MQIYVEQLLDQGVLRRKVIEQAAFADASFFRDGVERELRRAVIELKPNSVDDLAALVALYRPGPLKSGMVDDYIARKQGLKEVKYDLPQLAPILQDTYGVIAYQEQVMRIAQALAGFSLGQADVLRKAMGKKDPKVMAKQREAFMAGARQLNVNEKKATKIFDLMEFFAGYGFNKSHSTAYGAVAYQTAYLKAHYPAEFMAALLSSEIGNTDKVVQYINEARELGLEVLPPEKLMPHCREVALKLARRGPSVCGPKALRLFRRSTRG